MKSSAGDTDITDIWSLPSRERGLKFCSFASGTAQTQVAPLAGAWIEIAKVVLTVFRGAVAPLAGAWIEINKPYYIDDYMEVAPLAGAWIEI